VHRERGTDRQTFMILLILHASVPIFFSVTQQQQQNYENGFSCVVHCVAVRSVFLHTHGGQVGQAGGGGTDQE
jgi:hypothetical protein